MVGVALSLDRSTDKKLEIPALTVKRIRHALKLTRNRQLSADELGELAERLVNTNDLAEMVRLESAPAESLQSVARTNVLTAFDSCRVKNHGKVRNRFKAARKPLKIRSQIFAVRLILVVLTLPDSIIFDIEQRSDSSSFDMTVTKHRDMRSIVSFLRRR